VVTAEALAHILVVLLYVPVCVIVYWRLIPRLSSSAKKLATIMLVTQALVIALGLVSQPLFPPTQNFWSLENEKTLPAYFATTQLALVSAVALLTAWLARRLPAWRRLFLMALGLIFLSLAREESVETRHSVFGEAWVLFYAALGLAIAAATAVAAAKSSRHVRVWHICLLAGLAVAGTGALLIEQFRFPEICATLGFMPEAGPCQFYALEESLELLGIWLTLVAMLGFLSHEVPAAPLRVRLFLNLYPALAFVVLLLVLPSTHHRVEDIRNQFSKILFSLPFRIEYQFLAQDASVGFESDVTIEAYRIYASEGAVILEFFAKTDSWNHYTGLGYSMHLVDQVSGSSVAGLDAAASRALSLRSHSIGESHLLFKQRMKTVVPQEAAANRALWIVLTLWREREGEYVRQRIVSSSHNLLSNTQVVLGELTLPAESSASATAPLATFEDAITLGLVDLPERARSAETLAISFNWRAEKDGVEDYAQFLHFVHEETGAQWGYDQQPLGARLPTRLWYSGLSDAEVWDVPLPSDLAPGRYEVFTGLYRQTDLQRLPARDVEGNPFTDARIPLGSVTIGRI